MSGCAGDDGSACSFHSDCPAGFYCGMGSCQQDCLSHSDCQVAVGAGSTCNSVGQCSSPTDAGRDGGAVVRDAGRDAGRPMDAGRDGGVAVDGGVDASTPDGGTDAPIDASAEDAGAPADAGTDAATPSITVDGVVSDAEWAGAATVTNSVATDWGVGLNELTRLRAYVDGTDLWLAVEGVIESLNSIVVYVDGELGGTAGVPSPASLADSIGALDDALSAGITTPSAFRADYGFGTRSMSRTASGFDAMLGWRDIAADPGDFAWIDAAEAPAVCGTSACETRIALSRLPGSGARTIALFARITNADGTDLANQTLPEDAPATPATVTTLLELTVP